MKDLFHDVLWTLQCLTAVPMGRGGRPEPSSVAVVAVCFPVVGLGLGWAWGWVAAWASGWSSPDAAAAMTLALSAMVTGALHLDGLADTADGVFGGRTPERRLEIMRDSRVGAFGVVALVLVLLVKFAALGSLCRARAACAAAEAWAAAAMTARFGMVLAAGLSCYARPGPGTGRHFIDTIRPHHAALSAMVIAAALAGLPAVGGACADLRVWLRVVTPGLLAALGLTFYLRRRLGGLTGDTLGAIGECVEAVVLVAASAAFARCATP